MFDEALVPIWDLPGKRLAAIAAWQQG
jgi:hypothetical protein